MNKQPPIWEQAHFKENDRIMLDQLLTRNQKKKAAEALHQNILTAFVLLCGGFLLWIFYFGMPKSFSNDVWSLMFYLFSNEMVIFTILGLALLFSYWRQKHKKYKKEKDKFENLRSEVIEKRDKYWTKEYDSEVLAKFVTEMEGEHKINVSYKG